MRCATASPSAAYALPPKEKKSRLSGRLFQLVPAPLSFLLGGGSPRRDTLKRRMKSIDAVEINHRTPASLVGNDLPLIDVVIAFRVAEAAIVARFSHGRQTHGRRAGAVRAHRERLVRGVLLDHERDLPIRINSRARVVRTTTNVNANIRRLGRTTARVDGETEGSEYQRLTDLFRTPTNRLHLGSHTHARAAM